MLMLATIPCSLGSFGWGQCREFEFAQDLDLEEHSGTWYEVTRDASVSYENGACTQRQFKILENDKDLEALNAKVQYGQWKLPKIQALSGGSPKMDSLWWTKPNEIQTIETNFTSYSITHTCTSFFGLFHWNYNWLFSRQQSEPYGVESLIGLADKYSDSHYLLQERCP